MSHLSESEFVDLIDDRLPPARVAHVTTCAACREQSEALRAVLASATAVEAAEPSPLFWEHFPQTVARAIAEEPDLSRHRWSWNARALAPWAAAAAVVLAVASGMLLNRAPGHRGATTAAARTSAAVAGDVRADAMPDAENSEVWAVLSAAAATVDLDEAHDAGIRVHPTAVDEAVQDLSAAERSELGRLLQTELKRSSN